MIFCLECLSIEVNGILKSPVTVLLLVSPFMSSIFAYTFRNFYVGCINVFKILFYTIVNLQCYVCFRCTAKGFIYTYTHIHSFSDSFPHRLL